VKKRTGKRPAHAEEPQHSPFVNASAGKKKGRRKGGKKGRTPLIWGDRRKRNKRQEGRGENASNRKQSLDAPGKKNAYAHLLKEALEGKNGNHAVTRRKGGRD